MIEDDKSAYEVTQSNITVIYPTIGLGSLLFTAPGHLQRVILREFTTPGWCLRATGHGREVRSDGIQVDFCY